MKRNTAILLLLAAALVLGLTIGASGAYFTANDAAKGGYVLRIGHTPPIGEKFEDHKEVVITNEPDAATVFVRVKAFAAAKYQDKLGYTGSNWKKGLSGDFYYYYMLPLEGGTATDALHVSVSEVLPAGAEPGEKSNVIIAYESTPAIFTADGKPDFRTAWGADAPAAE